MLRLYSYVIKRITEINKSDTGIDIGMIREIHRVPDKDYSKVSFSILVDNQFSDLGAVRPRELDKRISALQEFLYNEGRFSVNSTYKRSGGYSKFTGLSITSRKEMDLRYLNACYLDVDCYKTGLFFDGALKIVLLAVDDKIIPLPSLICYSGRGMYLFWLLKIAGSDRPLFAFPDNLRKYKKVNKTIAKKLAKYHDMGIDFNAVDASRILRVPGSRNKINNHIVSYVPVPDNDNKPLLYTLDELADFYVSKKSKGKKRKTTKVKSAQTAVKAVEMKPKPKRNRNKIAGYRAVGEYIIEDMLKIEEFLGGIKKGRRRKTLQIIADSAFKAGYNPTDALLLIARVASRCDPPYPSDFNDVGLESIIWKSRRRKSNYRHDFLCSQYNISEEIAEKLGLKTITPIKKKKQSVRKTNMEIRRQKIREITKAGDLSVREIQKRLHKAGIKASVATIHKDNKDMSK